VTSINVGSHPDYAAYDSRNGYVYVVNGYSNNISVINGTKLVGSVAVGSFPGYVMNSEVEQAAAYDSSNGYVYVPNYGSDNVSVISGGRVVGQVAVMDGPDGAIYDDVNGYVYVMDLESVDGAVSVISGTTVVATIGVGSLPTGEVYDQKNGYVYVPNAGSNDVIVINGTSVVGSVKVQTAPYWATYDASNGFVYVLNYADDSVSVINGTRAVGTVYVGSQPAYAAYDPLDGCVFVSDSNSADPGVVSVIRGTALLRSVDVGNAPGELLYDEGTGYTYVATGPGAIDVINSTKLLGVISVGGLPAFGVYDSGNGYMYVPNTGSNNISAFFTAAEVNFTEEGLPDGTGWWVNVTGGPSSYSATDTLSIGAPEGTSLYSIATTNKTYSAPGGSFTVDGTAVSVTAVFSRVAYRVIFTEEGLPVATNWSVALNGVVLRTDNTVITFSEPNGTYAYEVGAIPGWATSVYAGFVSVSGATVPRSLLWGRVTYLVTFDELGLLGTGWWVNVTAGTSTFSWNNTLSFDEPNGTYSYSVSAVNKASGSPGGSFEVNGLPVLHTVRFSPVSSESYRVTFAEEGLRTGTAWSVTLVGVSTPSTTRTAIFTKPNGSFSFSIEPVPGYTPNPSSGTVTVSGGNVTQDIVFTALPATIYTVTFTESGLPSDSVWSVTFNGVSESGKGDLPFPEIVNGTYLFTVTPVARYTATPSSGSLMVSGPPAPQAIAFKAVGSSPLPSTFLGLPPAVGYGVLGGVIVAILTVTMLVVLLRRRGGKTHPEPVKSTSMTDPGDSPAAR
jgi:DNA-binding beta-propeller fold protein YncE